MQRSAHLIYQSEKLQFVTKHWNTVCWMVAMTKILYSNNGVQVFENVDLDVIPIYRSTNKKTWWFPLTSCTFQCCWKNKMKTSVYCVIKH